MIAWLGWVVNESITAGECLYCAQTAHIHRTLMAQKHKNNIKTQNQRNNNYINWGKVRKLSLLTTYWLNFWKVTSPYDRGKISLTYYWKESISIFSHLWTCLEPYLQISFSHSNSFLLDYLTNINGLICNLLNTHY